MKLYGIEYQRFYDGVEQETPYTELVRCTNCERYGNVDVGTHICPDCENDTLIDIEPHEINKGE